MNTKNKIVNKDVLKRLIPKHRKTGKKIAFTNGCFDILHFGHVSYLEKAKKSNRILILGLNSDKSVKKIKGPSRPIVSQRQRAAVVAALACIDYVVIFNEATPQELISYLRPDILIKGADWKGKTIAGSDVVKKHGGKIEYIHYLPNYSSSKIIKSIVRSDDKKK